MGLRNKASLRYTNSLYS